MFRHSEVEHPTPMVREHDEVKQNPEGRRRHGEEVDRRGLGQMIGQERSPGL
jgi:hypothetical protein